MAFNCNFEKHSITFDNIIEADISNIAEPKK